MAGFVCHQVFPVSAQVWPLCTSAQGDPYRLSLHYPSEGKDHSEEDGDHTRSIETQPQCLLHQLHELCGLFYQLQAKSYRTGELQMPPHMQTYFWLHILALLSMLKLCHFWDTNSTKMELKNHFPKWVLPSIFFILLFDKLNRLSQSTIQVA